MRFFCDEMLHGLGRWLRAAGYDTAIAEGGLPDPILAARCAEEDRILLTKDRHLAAVAGALARVVLLAEGSLDDDALALRNTLEVDWHYAPFTRCSSTTSRSSRRRRNARRRCRRGRGRPEARCGSALSAAASIGRAVMSAGCSSGSPNGKAADSGVGRPRVIGWRR